MAQKAQPVRVKPSVLQSNALKLITPAPVEGGQRPAELAFATTNNDTIKVNANYKRTPSNDTSELELQYADWGIFMEALLDAVASAEDNIEPLVCVGKSNYVGGQYSETPNPAGKIIFGRNNGIFWFSLVVGTGKPLVQWPLINTAYAELQNKEGQPVAKSDVSKWSARRFVNAMNKHLAIALDDRFIPWQHKNLIKEGKPTPYSDPANNYSYISTYNPNSGGGASNTPSTPVALPPMNFDLDIPF